MKWLLTTLFLFVIGFINPIFSQEFKTYFEQNDLQPEASQDGFFFQIEKEGKGAKAKKGDYVKIKYRGTLLDGTEFDVSEEGEPFVFKIGHRQVILGWDLGLQEFQEGGKGKLFVPSNLAYGKEGMGHIPSNADLVFEIELLEIMDKKEYYAYLDEQEAKDRKKFEEQKKQQFSEDKKIIQKYALKNKLRTKRMPSGVSYSIKKKGKGATAKPGDIVEVHYEGRLTDGTVFDSSFDGEPFKFVLGRGKVIEGWEQGLKNFKKGSQGWLLIPSQLAYGPRSIQEGDIHIPANSVLVFKIKVVSINSTKKK